MTLDKHHWDYEEDVTCPLCRDCHDYIHQNMRASEQGFRAITQGVRSGIHDAWVSQAIILLAIRELHHLPSSDRHHPMRSRVRFIDYLKHRYNIPLAGWEIDDILPVVRRGGK